MEQIQTDQSPMPAGWIRNSNLAQAWLVLVLALIFGASLAAVQVKLSPLIAANKMNETIEKVPELIWGAGKTGPATAPGKLEITPGTIKIEKNGATAFYTLFRVDAQGKPAGWVVKTIGQGYGDRIELLLGLNPDQTAITGLFILDQKETPGLGGNIVTPRWRKQFVGKATGQPLKVIKGGTPAANTIDAITGATISSRSVVGMINRTLGDLAGKLASPAVQFSKKVASHD